MIGDIITIIIVFIIISLLIIFLAYLVGFGFKLAYGAVDSNGNIVTDKPVELKCLQWNDGTMAVIQRYCTGEYETISWFLKHGYKIAAISVRTGNGEYPMVYMTR